MLATCGWWGQMPIQECTFCLKALREFCDYRNIRNVMFTCCFFEVPPSLKIHNTRSATKGRFHWRHLLQYPQAIVPWRHCYQSAITFCGSWSCVAELGAILSRSVNKQLNSSSQIRLFERHVAHTHVKKS